MYHRLFPGEHPRVVVANVLHGGHFVLVVGMDLASQDTLWVSELKTGINKLRT